VGEVQTMPGAELEPRPGESAQQPLAFLAGAAALRGSDWSRLRGLPRRGEEAACALARVVAVGR
jgi:hypothetical protein